MTKNLKLTKTINKCFLTALLTLPSLVIANSYKHSAVPTLDIAKQALPNASSGSTKSHSTMQPIKALVADSSLNKKSSHSQTLIVDSDEAGSIILLSPQANQMNLKLEAPDGRLHLDEAQFTQDKLLPENIALGNQKFLGKRMILPAASSGTWRISISPKEGQSFKQPPSGYILVKGDPSYQLVSHLDNTFTTQNSQTHIVAFITYNRASELNRNHATSQRPLVGLIQKTHAVITLPNGQKESLQLNDQGINGDQVAGDGKFTAPIPTQMLGTYTAEVYVEGTRKDGVLFSRSTADLYPVEKQTYDFHGQKAQLKALTDTRTAIQIPVTPMTNKLSEIFVAAEVWGTNKQGKREAATWVGGIVQPNSSKSDTLVELGFDYRWLTQADLHAPYELRNLRLQAIDTNTPIAHLDRLPIDVAKGVIPKDEYGLTNRYQNQSRALVPEVALKAQPYLTDSMLVGPAPGQTLSDNQVTSAKASGKVMLVHGYCSSDVWDSSHFSNDVKFKDFDQSRSHDQFARMIKSFGSNLPSFGVIAHSQGGAAALHLYAKYYSGLDYVSGGRLIQSVGTPYQGTSLAGNIAALGDIFGIACGRNTDLTYNGAANWLSTIPNWARAKVNYYTTSFTKKWWRPDWCNFASDMLLSDPEDGTTEKWSGQLAGANNRGHKIGWCHTRDMRDPAQALDRSRNREMNRKAAR